MLVIILLLISFFTGIFAWLVPGLENKEKINIIVASPRHADILLVTGTPTKQLATALRKTYEATPEPKVVIALGDCACGSGVYKDSYAVYNGTSSIVPVDVFIPGCPPTPEDIIKGLLMALDRLPK